ncbi:MAG: amidohydrolase family protein [Roseivirga sp.]|nr:amidohydrolase family protein [Roseivirga sp.]
MLKPAYLLILAVLICLGCSSNESAIPEYTVLKGATVFDGTGSQIEKAVMIIKDGKIQNIGGPKTEIPKRSEVIDVTGKFITPGLVDSHIHFAQTGFFDGRPDVVDLRDSLNFEDLQQDLRANPSSYYETYLRSGITAVYDVGGFEWSIERQTMAENNLSAPHVATAGPLISGYPETTLDFFNTASEKQMLYLDSPETGRSAVRRHSELGSTGIKVWGLILNDSTFMQSVRAVADETKKQGNQLIVHSTSLDQAKEALRLGAKVLVHSVDDQEIDDEFIQLAKANDVIYLPTLTVVRGYYEAYKSLKELRKVNAPNDVLDDRITAHLQSSTVYESQLPDNFNLDGRITGFGNFLGGYEAIMAGNLKKVHEAGITIAVATDAGNPGTYHGFSIYDEMIAMQAAGIPATDLITMATKNGAIAMKRSADFGTLTKGKMADLIVLDQDPSKDIANMKSITHVMRGGLLKLVNKAFH